VRRFFRQSPTRDLEAELVRQRPVARDEFVLGIVTDLEGRRARTRSTRVGAAVAFAGVAMVALGLGGTGYAYSSGSSTAKSSPGVKLDQSGLVQRPTSSSHAQYGPVPVPPYPKPKPTPPPPSPPSPPASPSGPLTPPATGGGTNGGSHSSGGQTSGGQTSGGSTTTGGQPSSSGTGNTAGASNGESSGLPFTGVSLVFPVLLGAGLIVLGIFLRRRARPSSD
jgi:hypothetical protein